MRNATVIFGATGGIGRQVCLELAQKGTPLALVARREERLRNLAAELETETSVHVADVTHANAVAGVFDAVTAAHGGFDRVLHAVGSILLKPAHRTSDDEWAQTLTLNLTSAFYVLREAVGRLRRTGGGNLVFCSTAAARGGVANHDAIAAAKMGLEGMVRSSAASYASKGIRINAVAPGLVDTPLAQNITRREASLKASQAMHALGRIGQPEDVAPLIVFLLEQTWMTGETVVIDGGLSGIKSAR
ncbi:MAG: SDR family oxidoreductase [Myxococcota bacterium]